MKILTKLFARKQDTKVLEKLELPELPLFPHLESKKKTKGAKAKKLPPFPGYISSPKNREDLEKMTQSIKKIEEQLAGLMPLRKELDVFKKMRLIDFEQIRRDLENVKKTKNRDDDHPVLEKELDLLRKELRTKKTEDIKELQSQLAEQEAELALLQEQVEQLKNIDLNKIKSDLLPVIQAKVVQHVFESRYDPKEMKEMKKQILAYITRAITSGHSEEKVKNALVNKGWPEELIAAYYDLVNNDDLKR